MTIQCCVCKRKREGEKWSKKASQPDPTASHTYCPACLQDAMANMRHEATLDSPAFAR